MEIHGSKAEGTPNRMYIYNILCGMMNINKCSKKLYADISTLQIH